MTEEFNVLVRNLDSSLFRYAHITGALEFYMLTLENPNLQRAVSKIISGSDTGSLLLRADAKRCILEAN